MKRVLVTGAAGKAGRSVLPFLEGGSLTLRLSDREPMKSQVHETIAADLTDFAAVERIVEGCDAIIHFGGCPRESAWPVIRDANIEGTYNLFEAARRAGCRRVVLASSTHIIGFEERVGLMPEQPFYRPDSIYGVSKLFGEGLASYYVDRFGFAVMALRIGLLAPRPRGWRNLANWIHAEDLAQLCRIGVEHPDLGFSVVYGVSATRHQLFDNARAEALGYRPVHSSHVYATEMEALRQDTDSYVGGPFVRGPDQSSFE